MTYKEKADYLNLFPHAKAWKEIDNELVVGVAKRYSLELPIEPGQVWWSKSMGKSTAGITYYQLMSKRWIILLNFDHYGQFTGQKEMEPTLAHELVHAYMVHHFGLSNHGSDFKRICRARGIPRHCNEWDRVASRAKPKQPAMRLSFPIKGNRPAQGKMRDNGEVEWVAPKASERGPKERQASLLDWADDEAKKEAWDDAAKD